MSLIKKKIDILIPLFNEEKNIAPLYHEIKKVVVPLTAYSFNILFIDDGSRDNSLLEILKLGAHDPAVRGLSFARNFGKEIALSAGIKNCNADAVIMMDADLQHPPSMIPQLVAEWEKGFDVIVCDRKFIEKRNFIRRGGSFLFNYIMQKISDTSVRGAGTDFRLLDRKVINALKKFTERNRLLRGLVDWLGFKRSVLEFQIPERLHGSSNYSFIALARLAINSLTSFSLLPLKITGYLGLLFSFLFGVLLIFMTLDRLTMNQFGFTNLAFVAVLNSFSLGIVMVGLGLIALYIGHIYTESVNRPMYIVRDSVNFLEEDVVH